MGKRSKTKDEHYRSLADELEDPQSQGVRAYPRKKARSQAHLAEAEDTPGDSSEQFSKVIALAKEQQQEDAREQARAATAADVGALETAVRSLSRREEWDSEQESDLEDVDDDVVDISIDEKAFTAEDEAAFNAFMSHSSGQQGKVLSDIISAKLREREPGVGGGDAPGEEEVSADMERIYEDVGKLLSRYTAGKLPKAFKVIPHLRNWEEILFMTAPQDWSPHATLAATTMFVSQLNTKQVQRFLNLILLNKVRDDIREHKRLHFALFQAVKKAVFKPAAFYKGFVLPLLKQGDCTLREAVIMSAVLNRVSVPMDHSAAALMRMADLPYSGVTSFMIKTLLDKKYALPYRTVDALVDHFMGFHKEERSLPVIWHLCLLTFVQRYKHEIREEDKDELRQLLKAQSHHKVTPEIYRELNHGGSRGKAKASGDVRMKAVTSAAEHVRNMAQICVEDMEY